MNFYEEFVQDFFPEVKLPERVTEFFESDEHKKVSGKHVSDLPYYRNWLNVSFKKNDILMLFEDYQDCDLEDEDNRESFMPFGSLEDAQFLAVNVKKKDCPVYMWEHENGKFYKLASSLDEFIKENLHDKDGINEERDDEEEE